jgi:hypothetical protein
VTGRAPGEMDRQCLPGSPGGRAFQCEVNEEKVNVSEGSKKRRHGIGVEFAKMLWAGVACTSVFAGAARADCIDDAARHYHVNADLLRSIAYYESHLNPSAIHRNENGSVDIGLMQINSIHLRSLTERGIDRAMLADASVNADVGASLLRQHIDEYGETWQAVGEYHSHSPAFRSQYAHAIHDIYVRRPWAKTEHPAAALSTGVVVQEIDAQ